jgi:predicted rRNA methylase YqxC with S4 and FtsJ domains
VSSVGGFDTSGFEHSVSVIAVSVGYKQLRKQSNVIQGDINVFCYKQCTQQHDFNK